MGQHLKLRTPESFRDFTTYNSRFNYHVTKQGKLNVLFTRRWWCRGGGIGKKKNRKSFRWKMSNCRAPTQKRPRCTGEIQSFIRKIQCTINTTERSHSIQHWKEVFSSWLVYTEEMKTIYFTLCSTRTKTFWTLQNDLTPSLFPLVFWTLTSFSSSPFLFLYLGTIFSFSSTVAPSLPQQFIWRGKKSLQPIPTTLCPAFFCHQFLSLLQLPLCFTPGWFPAVV